MTDPREVKYKEMQKYVPFIQRVIEKLKVNNDDQADNPRKAQLQKMEMLHDLLTSKQKKIKIETLTKCEGVLIKLQAKIEKRIQDEDVLLSDIALKTQTSCRPTTSNSEDTKGQEPEDILGPASPPPEVVPDDDIDQPVVIPTERRCSPDLVKPETGKNSAKELNKNKKEKLDHHRKEDLQHSPSGNFQTLRKKVFNFDSKDGRSNFVISKNNPTPCQQKHHENYHAKRIQHSTQSNPKGNDSSNSFSSKEKHIETCKSSFQPQKLQTVKVVITEPLPAHITKQFPSSSKYLPKSLVCHNNLRTLPQASQSKADNGAYNPEESWEQYNKQSSVQVPSTAPVFRRLGAKIPENSSANTPANKAAGRYTPITDVLKSPPLTVSDINNLLLESGGSDKILNDISEIGTRRPTKIEENQRGSPKNSFEFVRKKLAETAKMLSPCSETEKLNAEKDASKNSSLPPERIALKYNPHPRQERLQSVSSTDGSECSIQSNVSDPRIKLKLKTGSLSHSPTHVPTSNVNVLPAINLSDPRLKKQMSLPTPQEKTSLLSTPPAFSSTPNVGFLNKNPLSLTGRQDPRILSRTPTNSISPIQTTPTRKSASILTQRSTKENWDSDEDLQLAKKDKNKIECCEGKTDPGFKSNQCDNRNIGFNSNDTLNPKGFPSNSVTNETPTTSSEKDAKICPQLDMQHKGQSFCKQNVQNDNVKPKNKLIPSTTFIIPNPPKSDTEEDWDSEPEETNVKPKSLSTVEPPQLPINNSPIAPLIAPFHAKISPKTYVNPNRIPIPAVSIPPAHATPIPHTQSQHQLVGSNIYHNYRIQNSAIINSRFNSALNDKSERIKYFEAKKQKTIEPPRTYKEFREAKERALAQEIANKRAADEAEAKKMANEFKEIRKDKETNDNKEHNKKEKQIGTYKKVEDDKKERKLHQKDHKKTPAVESTLDKMYRTQNFNTNFPKANTSFKIPKKKPEEKTKEDQINTDEASTEKTQNLSNEKSKDKIKSYQAETSIDKLKSNKKKCTNENDIKTNQTEHFSIKQRETNICNTSEEAHTRPQSPKDSSKINTSTPEQHSFSDNKTITEEISSGNQKEKECMEEQKKSQQKSAEDHLLDNSVGHIAADDKLLNVRDPRCRPKPATKDTSKDTTRETFNTLGDIVISSSKDEFVLKPQQNLDKFNQLTQELSPKPQRILRRRNTMVVFDSAPLVDKEKLKKANALLFEDVQEEEKRKRKQAEEDRLIARRNKNLEEMFKKTDDNCTVSTQNIITGKRRTRATINFNETVNAINVFKHKTVKDSSSPPVQAIKVPKSNFKIKVKNLDFSETKESHDSDEDDISLDVLARKEAQIKASRKANKEKKDGHLLKCDIETKQKRSQLNRKSTSNNSLIEEKTSIDNSDSKFKPIQHDEDQNCAVSSTSTDNCTVEEIKSSLMLNNNTSLKKDTDDNEPTSTASKSSNSTPTPDVNEPVLKEIVDQILKPGANRVHILDVLGQILSEEKLQLIKSLISSCDQNNENKQITEQEADEQCSAKGGKGINVVRENSSSINKDSRIEDENNEQEEAEDEEEAGLKYEKSGGGKKIIPKKKRSELDRLNEDIRDMFICNGVLTATGRRMCTIMGKDVTSCSSKRSNKESTSNPLSVQLQNSNKKKEESPKQPVTTRTLRRSTRCCKASEDNEDNESVLSRTTEESIDDFKGTENNDSKDVIPQRKMPVLKPHTPIKMPEEVSSSSSSKTPKAKDSALKRKSESKLLLKAKRLKINKDDTKEDSQLEQNESESEIDEIDEDDQMELDNDKTDNVIKNTNVHWHNQSKYTTWCMICEKRIPANTSSLHYKTHHRENYISRMAPVILQQFKQGKLNQPLFGVKRGQKQPSWFYRCPFCLKYFNTPLPLWLEHFQNHTVEFRYECSKCHRCSNRKLTVSRHIKSCAGATVITSAIKLSVPTIINAHVCHLCNFIQLKRDNLERHYIEQHQLQKKTIDLLGYTIKLFDVENVDCVNEENAAAKEKEAWKSIEKDEQVIDIDDDEVSSPTTSNNDSIPVVDSENVTKSTESINKKDKSNTDLQPIRQYTKKEKNDTANVDSIPVCQLADINKQSIRKDQTENEKKDASLDQEENIKSQNNSMEKNQRKAKSTAIFDLTKENQNNDFEVIDEEKTAQDIQDELLALAAEAAKKDDNNENDKTKEVSLVTQGVSNENCSSSNTQTTMSDIISSSVDMIYNQNNASTDVVPPERKKVCTTTSNVFMPTRDEINYSPTIQILAQSIINIDEQGTDSVKDKPITMAERLSQRFKRIQSNATTFDKSKSIRSTTASNKNSNENSFEKLIDDTLLELTKEKDSATSRTSSSQPEQRKENAFAKLFSDTVLELEKDNDSENATGNHCKIMPPTESITVISDDEDWEDIEITETAPTASTGANIQKTKNKGLFQKFGIFKGNNTKSKKHLTPMVFLPKKKTKDKPSQATTLPQSSFTTATVSISKPNEINTSSSSNSNTYLSFKPVTNIMDGLFPDSPCNDPMDLVPELAPLEPLQDLNDISSILDSNLSAVNINAADNHTSIEDALDFISEQQANDKQKSTGFLSIPSQTKAAINNISHVGYSVQSAEESSFKFYCLLQNCSFLYSSDSIGLETHFMSEHSQIKWNGFCLMCQSQCFTDDDVEMHSISAEIRHMMEKHASKSVIDLNRDSNQNSNASSHDNDERPKIKLRRLTGDCLSRATPENVPPSNETNPIGSITNVTPMSMLGALLVADPKPPTKEMPPQPQMPLTEPLLLDNNREVSRPQVTFRNINSDFLITSVTSAVPEPNATSLQISNVISLNNKQAAPPTTETQQIPIPKISNVRTLAAKAGSMWSQQIEEERVQLAEAAEESLEVSRILENANRELSRSVNNDSPVLVAETVPVAQSKTGDFVVTQTVSAQYNEFSSTAVGFNISIAASTTGDKTNSEPTCTSSTSMSSRQYKCMGTGCKFVSRVPVAMSDHLRFHERRNFSTKRDYLACGFCFYCASDVEDYMKHANQFHIINNKGGGSASHSTTASESETVISLTKKIQKILNGNINSGGPIRITEHTERKNQPIQDRDSLEVYLKKLRETIDEIVGPTGLIDSKLYRCVVKNCQSQLSENNFLNHIMYHITTDGGNPHNYLYKCPHCKAQYYRPSGIKAHIKNHGRSRYFCYLCDEVSTNPGQLLEHFSEKHWRTLRLYTKELLPPKMSTDGSDSIIDSSYYVVYDGDLCADAIRRFGEKLILEWKRKKTGSKTHFKSTEIDLLPMTAIFKHEVNCGECEYKTKVRTNMFRHLLMHKQNPDLANKSGTSQVSSVDPVNPVPCLNSTERFFDKMTNLASSSLLTPNSGSFIIKSVFKLPQGFVEASRHFTCGCQGCNYHTISEDLFRTHLSTLHSSAMTYCCIFCKEEICKRGISIDRIINHKRFHGTTIYRCEECNYIHYLRYVVERHINEKHATMKVNIVTHNRSTEDSADDTTTIAPFAGKRYKEDAEINQTAQTSTNSDICGQKPIATYVNNAKNKEKYLCDVCGHRTVTVGQMQTHCQQQHAVKNQYKCAHCSFGSQQISHILHHIDEKHSGKTREARCMYHKTANSGEEVEDTRPLWQRNDPKRVRHIRGILMEDEEESEEYRKKLALTDDDDSNEDQHIDVEEMDGGDLNSRNYVSGYEFGCYHCSFKTETFEDLRNLHYAQSHNYQLETAKPFWYRLHRRLCCPECRLFIGNYCELQQHLQNTHKKSRFYACDIKMAENDDTSQRILCGYCSFHFANIDHLYKHHLKAQHWPQDIRIDNNEQIMDILDLGKAEVSYQCTLCADIFPNRVAIVQHACNSHTGEDSFREITNSVIYKCNSCCFTSTTELDLLRHTIDHYSHFKFCNFCHKPQSSFIVYMQHCYAEHKNDIQKFKTIYPVTEIRKFLLQILIIFPSGLVLNKRNLLNTKYGETDVIEELYEEIYKISQQPPIPRLSIARLVARKSIEAQQKHGDYSSTLPQERILDEVQQRSKRISKRRCTVAFSLEDDHNNSNSIFKPKINIVAGKTPVTIAKRRTTMDHDQQQPHLENHGHFNPPLQHNKISKRRRTVAVDRETLFSSNLMSSTNSLLTEIEVCGKKRKTTYRHSHTPSPKYVKEVHPLNLDMEPFSFYGQTSEALDLSKIYTKVAIGGIKTPLTIDKFKLLFNIDCQLKLTKCDENGQFFSYSDYKHIKKPCPASQKLKHN